MKCCFCNKEAGKYGNNADPVMKEGRCCNQCNINVVIPIRLLKCFKAISKDYEERDGIKRD